MASPWFEKYLMIRRGRELTSWNTSWNRRRGREFDPIMTEPTSPIASRPDPARVRKTFLIVAIGSLFIVAIAWALGARSRRTTVAARSNPEFATRADYVSSRDCAGCHPGEVAAHQRSGHAMTLRPAAATRAARRLGGGTFADPERPEATWSYRLRDDRLTTERREAGDAERFVIDYAFGSGHHATTFVSLIDRTPSSPTMIEHRLSVYAHRDAPDITPGQGKIRGPNRPGMGPSGRRYTPDFTRKCFECHSTILSERGPLVLDEATMIPNVGCERCHGPGRAHVQAARRGAGEVELAMPFGLGNWTTADELKLCGSCHRLPEMGDRAVIRPDNPGLVRFQPIGLMESACYRKTRGGLSCTSCHDPHSRTLTDLPAYEAVCLTCHKGPPQTVCKVSPETGCVGCHMPRRDVARGMMMTDHWIRTRPVASDASDPASAGNR